MDLLLVFLRNKKSIAELFLGLRFRVLGLGLHNCTTRQPMVAQTLAPVESVGWNIIDLLVLQVFLRNKKALLNSTKPYVGNRLARRPGMMTALPFLSSSHPDPYTISSSSELLMASSDLRSSSWPIAAMTLRNERDDQ